MKTITFLPDNLQIEVNDGISLLEAQILAGYHPDAPCGGGGTCGKCLVTLLDEDGDERVVKSCRTYVDRDMTLLLSEGTTAHRILQDGKTRTVSLNPAVSAKQLAVKEGSLTDLRSDWDRVKEAIAEHFSVSVRPNLRLAASINSRLKELSYAPYAVVFGDELLDLKKSSKIYTAAVDIGTTTVVLYLLDSITGETLAVKSTLNPQTEFGGDVIMRANYALENGVDRLSHVIREALNKLLSEASEEAKISLNDIYSITVVGNTCMHHLFLGVSPESLVLAPYHPAISEGLILNSCDYDLSINPCGKLFLLPCIAGFVGADTAGVMLSCEMDTEPQLTLAIDIGTNGELVLGNSERLVTCSTAAGPAFEGAKIACGMRGGKGAIDHVTLENGVFSYTVIDGGKPVGICGSGLMDLTAVLLDAGVIDETGRIVDDDELDDEMLSVFGDRLVEADGLNAVLLASPEESGNGKPVYLNQKDVREVQLAKGAMAAGIQLMLKALGKKTADIEKVLIAGAFGNYMSPHSACRIGLIPAELEEKIVPVGNAAGEGAKIAALNYDEFLRCKEMIGKTGFIELASDPEFQDSFVDELMFPEED